MPRIGDVVYALSARNSEQGQAFRGVVERYNLDGTITVSGEVFSARCLRTGAMVIPEALWTEAEGAFSDKVIRDHQHFVTLVSHTDRFF